MNVCAEVFDVTTTLILSTTSVQKFCSTYNSFFAIVFQALFCHPNQPRWAVLHVHIPSCLVTKISRERLWTTTRGIRLNLLHVSVTDTDLSVLFGSCNDACISWCPLKENTKLVFVSLWYFTEPISYKFYEKWKIHIKICSSYWSE